jgi:hypothetical protein
VHFLFTKDFLQHSGGRHLIASTISGLHRICVHCAANEGEDAKHGNTAKKITQVQLSHTRFNSHLISPKKNPTSHPERQFSQEKLLEEHTIFSSNNGSQR